MPHVAVGPGDLYYEVRGEAGPPVLYIFGLGSYMVPPNAYRLEDRMAARARVLLVDNRGVGRSAPLTNGTYRIEGFADDAAGVLDALAWDRAHVVGISMGGMIAQAFAHRHPDRTATLALLATTPGGSDTVPPTDAVMAILENRDGLPPAEATRRSWTTSYTPEFIERERAFLEWRREEQARTPLDPRVYGRHLAAARRFDATAWLNETRCPTLVVWGEADQLIPAENSQRLARLVPGARTLALPGLGHGFPTEAAGRTVEALRDLWSNAPVVDPAQESV